MRDTSSGAERELRGAARRIACFAVSAYSASPVVAYAESGGLDPKIHVHQVDTLERVATPILNRPKPAPKKEEPPAETEEAEPMKDGSEPAANADGEETNDEAMDDAADSLD